MELSRITVRSAVQGADGLYCKGGRTEDGALFLCSGETADFRTYFSSLDTQLLLEKTTVRRVTLRLFFDGNAVVRLYRSIPTDGKPKKQQKAFTQYVAAEREGAGEIRIESDVYGGGILGFTVTALTDTDVYGGVWECPDECRLRRPRLGAVVCTYHREEDVRRNLNAYSELFADDVNLETYIVDNGGTLTEAEMPDGVTLIANRNLGGSGGFSRGMIECLKAGKTHVLLMEDDVAFDPDVVRRTAAILSVLRQEHESCGVGGAVMTFSRPDVVIENGAKCGGVRLVRPKLDIPVTEIGGLLWCRADCDVNYCGWRYFCVPATVLLSCGLSMPFFLKYDDAEFGMRISSVSPTIYTIGVGVWHKDLKEPAPYLGYYLRRNAAIAHATSGRKRCGRRNRIRLAGSYFAFIFKDRRKLNYMFDGFDDYLKGPDFLLETDGEELNRQVTASPRKNRGFFGATWKAVRLFFALFRSRSVNKKYREKREALTGIDAWTARLHTGEEE